MQYLFYHFILSVIWQLLILLVQQNFYFSGSFKYCCLGVETAKVVVLVETHKKVKGRKSCVVRQEYSQKRQ